MILGAGQEAENPMKGTVQRIVGARQRNNQRFCQNTEKKNIREFRFQNLNEKRWIMN